VEAEQALVIASDLVVFQHPIFWYSMPALLKQWLDVVLENGWAYGEGGSCLRKKDCWLVVSTGGSEQPGQEGGSAAPPFSAFLPQFQQIARVCGMRWLPPCIFQNADHADENAIAAHAENYRQRLAAYPDWPELVAPAARIITSASSPPF
jgi:glutathione-regulated potassium-efflux system ancillary protein KefF